jgi:hypothetical protein
MKMPDAKGAKVAQKTQKRKIQRFKKDVDCGLRIKKDGTKFE